MQHEQQGKARAQYSESVISSLAARLTRDFGRGLDERNVWYMRSFNLAFPILNAARSELPGAKKRAAMRRESPGLRPELAWTHYRLLFSVEDPAAPAIVHRCSHRHIALQTDIHAVCSLRGSPVLNRRRIFVGISTKRDCYDP